MSKLGGTGRSGGTVRLGDVLRIPEFGWLLVAVVQSQVGNQLARVALAVAVFQQTGSATQTSAVFALTFFPAILGGLLLSQFADRFPRRDVMVVLDLARAGAFCVMAVLALPVGALYALVAAAALLGPPFTSAQMAALPAIVGAERFPTAAGIVRTGDQIASLAGYGIGGVVVALLGARASLGVDAASFAVSAGLLTVGLARRGMPPAGPATVRRHGVGSVAGTVFGDRRLRLLIGLACTVGFYVTPEALAAPYAHQLGHGAVATGLLMASVAVGVAVGNVLLLRLVSPERRANLIGVLAAAAALPLVACVGAAPLIPSLILWFLCGVLCSFVVVATATYSITVDDSIRGAAIGLASSLLLGSQGAAALIAGAVATVWSPSVAIGLSGAAGLCSALVLSVRWRTVTRCQTASESPLGRTDDLTTRPAVDQPGHI